MWLQNQFCQQRGGGSMAECDGWRQGESRTTSFSGCAAGDGNCSWEGYGCVAQEWSWSEAATRQPGTWGEPPGMRGRTYFILSPSRGRRDLWGPPHHCLLWAQTEQPCGKQSGATWSFPQGCQRTKRQQMTSAANLVKSLSDWPYYMHRFKINWAIQIIEQKKIPALGFVSVPCGSGQRSRGHENGHDNSSDLSDSPWSLVLYLSFYWSLIWGPWDRT